MTRARAWLQLFRLPNLFTAAADPLAGFLFVGLGFELLDVLGLLVGASVLFYAAGVALNDVLDAAKDARERPHRPIPSGAVSRGAALVATIVLFAVGLWMCARAGPIALQVGALLVLAIVLYDVFLKKTVVAPGVMGMCRALNLLLGMSCVVPLGTVPNVFVALVMWVYVTGLTAFARNEAAESSRWKLRWSSRAIMAAVLSLALLWSILPDGHWAYLLLVGLLLGQVRVMARRAVTTCAPADVQRAVKSFVLMIIVLDACIVFAAAGPLKAGLVLCLLVPTIVLGKRLAMT